MNFGERIKNMKGGNNMDNGIEENEIEEVEESYWGNNEDLDLFFR